MRVLAIGGPKTRTALEQRNALDRQFSAFRLLLARHEKVREIVEGGERGLRERDVIS
jgi:hypothetical protein